MTYHKARVAFDGIHIVSSDKNKGLGKNLSNVLEILTRKNSAKMNALRGPVRHLSRATQLQSTHKRQTGSRTRWAAIRPLPQMLKKQARGMKQNITTL